MMAKFVPVSINIGVTRCLTGKYGALPNVNLFAGELGNHGKRNCNIAGFKNILANYHVHIYIETSLPGM